MVNPLILQGFNWHSCNNNNHYNHIKANLCKIHEMNITKLWLPPSSQSKHKEGYYPIDYFNLNSSYGTENELSSLLSECKTHDISTIGEIVCWNEFSGYIREPYKFGDTILDINSPNLYEKFAEYVLYLQSFGFSDFRLDCLKNQPCYDVGLYLTQQNFSKNIEYIGEYWDVMNYDENWNLSYDQNSHRQTIVDYIDKTYGRINMFDFTLKGILQEAIDKNEFWRLCDLNQKPPGVNGWYSSNAITFIDNHDTLGQHHWPFSNSNDKDKIISGYAYIMTHPGTPCIYYDHFYELNDEMKVLANIRNKIEDFHDINIINNDNKRYEAIIDNKFRLILGECLDNKNGLLKNDKMKIEEV